ncbi:plastocyanin/azurin family copper-binding protein [Halobacteria archaeon AArc-curdl1]|uniref:Plastocyanin/azurin family copper-binding protein n=1 Tax=Natronosalvus hydrolyticus TaxID=2979988 RepID=A0AAP3E4V5_9EURY|nr:plastocyanin/azurin family copper-binding protein [Halobacteria archaeon AArc-curdl1]
MKQFEEDEPLSRRLFLAGAAGTAVAAGATATGMAQEDEEDEAENGDDAPAGGGTEFVEVGDNYYEPENLAIEPGTTVVWEWVGVADHNINPSDQPDGADWEGHPDLKADGDYEYTFTEEGTYEYVCDPHVGVGMVGSIEVAEGASAAPEGPAQLVPDAAWTLIVATVAGMVSTLSLVYFFMRYGGKPAE